MTFRIRFQPCLCGIMLLLLLLAGVAAVQAQAVPEYRVGPEDILSISLRNSAEAGATVLVSPDGSIQLPIVGKILVANATLPEITKKLTEAYSQRYRNPEVTVTLVKPRDIRVYALGEVRSPNIYKLTTGERLVELLAEAGGLTVSVAEGKASLLRAASGEMVAVDLRAAFAGAPEANLKLEPGDVLTISRIATISVFVTGEVKTAGLIALPEGAAISQAIAMAGGLTLAPQEIQVAIFRNGQRIPAAYDAPTVLQRGDQVQVTSRLLQVFVSGEVQKSNSYLIRDGLGLAEAITMAGGFSAEAEQSGVILTHSDGTIETVDMVDLLARGANIILRGDDRVFVPRNTARIAVLGRGVLAPQSFLLDVKHPWKVTEAIARAGGISKLALPKKVTVIRMVNNMPQRIETNLEDILRNGHLEKDIPLHAGDIVYVPDGKTDTALLFQTFATFGLVFNAFK